jgi:hypothetical protein
MNDAERVVEAAAATVLPRCSRGKLPDLVILMIDEQAKLTWHCAEFSRPSEGAAPVATFKSSLPWEPIVQAHGELDRGSNYLLPVPEPWPWSLVWHVVDLALVVDVRPFRSGCLTVDRGLAEVFRLWFRQGRRRCCWYHQCDWRVASALAMCQLAMSQDRERPSDEAARAVRQLQGERQADLEAALSLLMDPIHVSSNGSLGNGQHRVRAMLDQGVLHAPATRSVHDDDLEDALAIPGTYLFDST